MTSYLERFQSAAIRSTLLYGAQLNPALVLHPGQAHYGQPIVNAIVADFMNGVVTSSSGLPGNCYAAVREASYVLFELGIDNAITIGNVLANGWSQFTTTVKSIEKDFEEGFQLKPVNAHAWLTLDTGQILDPTILPWYAHSVESRTIPLSEAIYLSGQFNEVQLDYEPYITGFAYHLNVVSSPANFIVFKMYTDWLEHTYIFKRNIAKKRDGFVVGTPTE